MEIRYLKKSIINTHNHQLQSSGVVLQYKNDKGEWCDVETVESINGVEQDDRHYYACSRNKGEDYCDCGAEDYP